MTQQISPTKQRILSEALTLFAVKGYEPVTVAAIAEAVGIKAPSLYKHYKSKRDIFDAILTEMKTRYQRQAASMQMNGTDAARDTPLFADIGEESLIEMSKGLFLYFLHDDFACKFRKMLTVEQYQNAGLSALYTKQYFDDPIDYQSMLFGLLGKTDTLVAENARIMALQFYAPVFLLLTLCDRHPNREEEALRLIEQHVRQFARLYQGERS
ncbi:MAG TPA: TetR/AcrR family transcriptional regulator [Ruminococcaceae bacterium]|nr:TetR/AcrR family transcriptional regulator [Oscillospiraceae bacterium]